MGVAAKTREEGCSSLSEYSTIATAILFPKLHPPPVVRAMGLSTLMFWQSMLTWTLTLGVWPWWNPLDS